MLTCSQHSLPLFWDMSLDCVHPLGLMSYLPIHLHFSFCHSSYIHAHEFCCHLRGIICKMSIFLYFCYNYTSHAMINNVNCQQMFLFMLENNSDVYLTDGSFKLCCLAESLMLLLLWFASLPNIPQLMIFLIFVT